MAINESGLDYFRSTGVLTIGSTNELTVAQLGLLGGSASGTNLLGNVVTNIELTSASEDQNLNIGEAFTLTRSVTTTPVFGSPSTVVTTTNLTLVGSGTFSSLGSILTGNADVLIGQDQTGARYVVFPDGNMPTGLLGATVGTVLTTLELEPVGYNLTDGTLLCFAAGTMIRTAAGDCAIEDLMVGELVATKDNGLQPVRWISSNRISAAALARKEHLRPILIRAGALGDNTPAADLIVSPQHRVLVRSKIAQKMFGAAEVLVAAKQLLQLDGIDICAADAGVEYFHMLFDQHEVVFANGAEAESLYTGPEALKWVGKAALDEIFEIFPELNSTDYAPEAARVLASGRQGRKLVARHMQHGRPLVDHA